MSKLEKVTRISGISDTEINIRLAKDDRAKFERLFTGVSRLSIKDGQIVEESVFTPPPSPIEDPAIEPYWPQLKEKVSVQTAIKMPKKLAEHSSPSIIIRHLCGYDWTPENYKIIAERLESWGFVCLRSRREAEGNYWESWILHGLWQAKNELKEYVNKNKRSDNNALDLALKFLRHNSSFGTLDVTVQRMAQVID